MRRILFSSLFAVSVVAGCGGSSSDNGTANNSPTPQEGQFIDAAVEGLPWQTDTLSGTTDSNGTFRYLPGESVTFNLLGLSLGPVAARSLVTPQSFNAAGEHHDDYWLNLVRLLMTLDADSTPSNGITLPDASGLPDLSAADLDVDAANLGAQQIIQDLLNAMPGNVGLVTALDAMNHFDNSMDSAYELDLAGRTLFNWRTRQGCEPELRNTFTYQLSETGYQMTGNSGDTHPDWPQAPCFPSAEPVSDSGDYSAIANDDVFNVALSCGPVCSYADLNRTINLNTGGTIILSHLAGSDTIEAVQRDDTDALQEKHILRFVDPAQTINLAGLTVEAKLYFPECPGDVGTRTYEFGQDSVTITEPDGGHQCDGYPMDGQTFQYENLSMENQSTRDYWFSCAPECSMAELNRNWSVLGYALGYLDLAKEILVWHEPGSDTVTLEHMHDEFWMGVPLQYAPDIFDARPREEVSLTPITSN